jgi:hypothetical protein
LNITADETSIGFDEQEYVWKKKGEGLNAREVKGLEEPAQSPDLNEHLISQLLQPTMSSGGVGKD